MLQARRGGIQDWMLEGHDPTSQTEGDDAVVAQLPDPLVGIPRSAGLLHSPPSRDIGIRDPQRYDLVRGEPRLPLGSEDRMKRLASRLTWWHTLPHKSTSRSTPQRGEASHGPYWHRRAQEGKADLHPRRWWRGHRAPDPHRARTLRRRARGPAPRSDCDR